MILITDCLSEKTDEGVLKVANRLAKCLKGKCPRTMILSYGRKTVLSDIHLDLNKLFLNKSLFSILRKMNKPVLYIPFSSNTKASILRTYILSVFSRNHLFVLFALRHPMDKISKILLRHSRAEIITLSADSYQYFSEVKGKPAVYLKAAVDTQKYTSVGPEEKVQLRRRYQIPENARVLLHVGHLKEGRNIQKLLNIPDEYHLLLVISTLNTQDMNLRKQLEKRPNTTIIDSYIENIEQIYQLSDIYIFPVQEEENCIDVPLSVMEAASCGIPVVATDFGELKSLFNRKGFYPIESFEPDPLEKLLHKAYREKANGRQSVQEYDWNLAASYLLNLLQEKGK